MEADRVQARARHEGGEPLHEYALRQAGVTHFDMPASPARLWTALQAAKRGAPGALAVAQ